MNADGVPDLLIGAPDQNGPPDRNGVRQQRRGQAYVFSGALGVPLHTLDDPIPPPQCDPFTCQGGAPDGPRFGAAVARVGDVNGDGVPDLMVGAPREDAVLRDNNEGRVFLFMSVSAP